MHQAKCFLSLRRIFKLLENAFFILMGEERYIIISKCVDNFAIAHRCSTPLKYAEPYLWV